jgi:hypothetical protein
MSRYLPELLRGNGINIIQVLLNIRPAWVKKMSVDFSACLRRTYSEGKLHYDLKRTAEKLILHASFFVVVLIVCVEIKSTVTKEVHSDWRQEFNLFSKSNVGLSRNLE